MFEAFPFLLGKLGRRGSVVLVEVWVNLWYVGIVIWLSKSRLCGDPRLRLWGFAALSGRCARAVRWLKGGSHICGTFQDDVRT